MGKLITDNPLDHLDTPMWCVYGPDCFPTIICFKVSKYLHYTTIWGYSVYKRKPGFRTLGQDFETWDKQHKGKYFLRQEDAIAYLTKITTPKIKS